MGQVLRDILDGVVHLLEETFNPVEDRESMKLTKEHLSDINAACERNYWFDKKGNKWPLRDSL